MSSLKLPDQCRRCGSPIDDQSSPGRGQRRCNVCGYVTAVPPSTVIHSPLGHFAEWVPSSISLLADNDDHASVITNLSRLRHEALNLVQDHVDNSPATARQWLISLLANAGELSRKAGSEPWRGGSYPYRIVQLMYALLLRRGPLDFTTKAPSPPSSFFIQDAYTILSDIAALSTHMTLARRNLYQYRIVQRELVGDRSREDLELFELAQNIAVEPVEQPRSELFEDLIVETQKLLYGRSVQDLFAIIDPRGADTGLAGHSEGDVIFVDIDRSTEASAQLVSTFVLTADRLQRFAAPYFFDLGPPAKPPRTEELAVNEAGDILWLAYYPFLDAHMYRGPRDPMAITTVPLLRLALSTIELTQAHGLYRFQWEARRRDSATKQRVNRLTQRLHAQFEGYVGERFRAGGMAVQVGITDIDGQELDCGEIDVLAVNKSINGELLIVVCEAKNVDLAVQKDQGYKHLSETMDKARVQVADKSSWVARSWPKVAGLFGLSNEARPTVLGMIVTRRPVPLSMLANWPGAVPGEVEAIVNHLLTRPTAEWRSDLTAGIVTST